MTTTSSKISFNLFMRTPLLNCTLFSIIIIYFNEKKELRKTAGVVVDTVQYSTVQYSTEQFSTVHYSRQYSRGQYSTVQCSTLQCSTVQYTTLQCSYLISKRTVDRSNDPISYVTDERVVCHQISNIILTYYHINIYVLD